MRELRKTDETVLKIKRAMDASVLPRGAGKKDQREMVKKLLNNRIILESDSPYANPITLMKKNTNNCRICVDYRKLNARSIDDQIDKFGGPKYFTGLNLASGCYQVSMAENSTAKTTFVTREEYYELLRMPFRLTNVPATF